MPDGPHRGEFHADLTPLAELTGDRRFEVCLARTFGAYADAVAAEVAFIERNWVLEGARDGTGG